MSTVRLFCIPYAGGSAAMYMGFRKHLAPRIELCPVELAGRGQRQRVPFPSSVAAAAADVVQMMRQRDLTKPYALYGHSLGGLLAYEACRALRAEGGPLPAHVFISGKGAPHRGSNEQIHRLPDDEFMREVIKIGGTPPEIFGNRELTEYYLPILRADFRIAEEYRFVPDGAMLDRDFTVLGGTRDELTVFDLAEWKKYTSGKTVVRMLPGGHLFINDNVAVIAAIINETILR